MNPIIPKCTGEAACGAKRPAALSGLRREAACGAKPPVARSRLRRRHMKRASFFFLASEVAGGFQVGPQTRMLGAPIFAMGTFNSKYNVHPTPKNRDKDYLKSGSSNKNRPPPYFTPPIFLDPPLFFWIFEGKKKKFFGKFFFLSQNP